MDASLEWVLKRKEKGLVCLRSVEASLRALRSVRMRCL